MTGSVFTGGHESKNHGERLRLGFKDELPSMRQVFERQRLKYI